ncbi:MAG: hypothetical protein K1060chlam4_00588 [Candidatus Anoxychlamydiales bacterium]|nr:hypothetical protein [Candidatus Anoxychlamydiales bacterium]
MSFITSSPNNLSLKEFSSIKYFFEDSTKELPSFQKDVIYDQILKVMKKSLSDEDCTNFLNSEMKLLCDQAKIEIFFQNDKCFTGFIEYLIEERQLEFAEKITRTQEDNITLVKNLLSKIGLKYQDLENDDEHERIIVQQFGYGFNADFSPCLLLAYYEENIVVKTIRATHSILKKIPLI